MQFAGLRARSTNQHPGVLHSPPPPVLTCCLVGHQCAGQALHLLPLLLHCRLALQHLSSIRGAAAEGHTVACCCALPVLKPVTATRPVGGLVGSWVSRLVGAAVPVQCSVCMCVHAGVARRLCESVVSLLTFPACAFCRPALHCSLQPLHQLLKLSSSMSALISQKYTRSSPNKILKGDPL